MNNFNFEAMMEHGFLIIPKALLQQQIEDPNIEAGEIEALLKILMKVNYSDTLYSDRQHKDYLCKRGESMFSYRDWSRIFPCHPGDHRNRPPSQQLVPAYPCRRIRQMGRSPRQRQAEKESRQREVPPVLE